MSSKKSPGQGKPWGRITWYFIHTFCERIDETFFIGNREKVLNVLSNVCSMIPCPTCRAHSSQYLKKNPLMKIVRNKDELKAYFFRFHNHATLNGNPSARPADPSVIEMYKQANFKRIVDAFRAEYIKKSPTRLDYAHTLYAQRILNDTISFLNTNQRWFMVKKVQPTNNEQQPTNNEQQPTNNEKENITFSIVE
uniref:thiol oxidase n=1 Tax=viral metagenome TaxID=1070528 RepID=A0A6C0BUV3_9ZZZZ